MHACVLYMQLHEPFCDCSLNWITALIIINQQLSMCSINVTGYGKRAHFAQELIFQNKQLKLVTPLDFVHNSDSVKCSSVRKISFFSVLRCI